MRHPSTATPLPQRNVRQLLVGAGLALAGLATIWSVWLKPDAGAPDDPRGVKPGGVFASGVTSTKVVTKTAAALGTFAADEVLNLIGRSGTIIFVHEIPPAGLPDANPLVRSGKLVAAQVQACKDRLRQKGKFTFGADLHLLSSQSAVQTEWPPGELARLLRREGGTPTIIAFCQLPEPLGEEDRRHLRQRNGKLVMVGGEATEKQAQLRTELTHLAIARRTNVPPAPSARSETPDQWARRVHVALRPEAGSKP